MKGLIKEILKKAVKRKKSFAVVKRLLRMKHNINVSVDVLANRLTRL